MKLTVFALFLICAWGFVEPDPETIDDISASLMKSSGAISVLAVYETEPDYVLLEPFYELFNGHELSEHLYLIPVNVAVYPELHPIKEIFDVHSLPSVVVLNEGEKLDVIPLNVQTRPTLLELLSFHSNDKVKRYAQSLTEGQDGDSGDNSDTLTLEYTQTTTSKAIVPASGGSFASANVGGAQMIDPTSNSNG